jgi:hypothetical protein
MNVYILASTSVPFRTHRLQCGHCGDLPEISWGPWPVDRHRGGTWSLFYNDRMFVYKNCTLEPNTVKLVLNQLLHTFTWRNNIIIQHPLSFYLHLYATDGFVSHIVVWQLTAPSFLHPCVMLDYFSYAPVWKLGSPSLKGPCVTVGCPAPWPQMQLMMLKKSN